MFACWSSFVVWLTGAAGDGTEASVALADELPTSAAWTAGETDVAAGPVWPAATTAGLTVGALLAVGSVRLEAPFAAAVAVVDELESLLVASVGLVTAGATTAGVATVAAGCVFR